MRSTFVVAIIALALCAKQAEAFDQERKGFVLGLGAGIAPYAALRSNTDSGGAPVDENSVGFAAQFVIGYAWDATNWIVYEGNVASRESKAYDAIFGQGFNGLSWYHAYGPRGRSWITAVGAGFQVVSASEAFVYYTIDGPRPPAGPPTDDGLGFLAGVGYEFRPRTMIMMYGSTGTTKDWADEFRQSHVSLMLGYLWD